MEFEIIDDGDLDDIVLAKETEQKEDSRNYVDNEKFSLELGEWAKIAREHLANGERYQMSDYLGRCIMLIAQNVSRKHNYVGYSFRDEMVADAIVGCIRYLHNFNLEKIESLGKKPNAFAYVTQLVNNHFGKRILDERREQYVKLKSYEFHGGSDMLDDDSMPEGDTQNDILMDYQTRIAEYEHFIELRKQRSKERNAVEVLPNPYEELFE